MAYKKKVKNEVEEGMTNDTALINEAVAKVEADIEAARVKREEDETEETEEEMIMRENAEESALRVARGEVSKEEQLHLDARDSRVASVKAAIETLRLARELKEKDGVTETEGAKLDREAKEAKDLLEASELNVIELVSVDINNAEMSKLADKVNEVIKFLNGYCRE